MVEDDLWVYFVNHWDVQAGIYKELPAGSNTELVVGLTVDDDHRINLLGVQNDAIYYSYIKDLEQEQALNRIDPSGRTVLLQTIDYSGFDLTLDGGGWIYYLVNSESERYGESGFCFNTLKRASVNNNR